MPKLLYHAPETPDQESPFDRAIVQVACDQDVKIVSPYISLDYLQRLIQISRSWRLVSDVLEWLSATPRNDRDIVYDFFNKHDGLIHHYPAIHAKTVLSGAGVYTGSANLTQAGILRRTEFGALLTDVNQIQEAHDWFDAIWLQTSPPPLTSVRELISELNGISSQAMLNSAARPAQIDSTARRVRARLVNVLGYKPISLKVRQQIKDERIKHNSPCVASNPLRVVELSDSLVSTLEKSTSVVHEITPPAHIFSPAASSPVLNTETPLESPPPALVLSRMTTFDFEREIQGFIDKHAGAGFTINQCHTTLRRLAHSLQIRDTYLALIEWCASHPRSLFSDDAVHRLVYSNGLFIQSNEVQLQRVLKPMDDLVSRIIDTLSFSEPSQLPIDEIRHNMPVSVVNNILTSMINAGFICTDEGLRLIPTVRWSQRLKLLKGAYGNWSNRVSAYEFNLAKQRTLETQNKKNSTDQSKLARRPLIAETITTSKNLEDSETLPNDQIERMAKFDKFFTHLAWLYATKGEIIECEIEKLTADLMDVSKLSLTEVKRLMSGTYTLLRSPFAVMQTSHKKKLRIYHDLIDNTHLENYPSTRQIIDRSPSLINLKNPPKPLDLPRLDDPTEIQKAANRIIGITMRQADDAYALICQYIFENLDNKNPPVNRRIFLRALSDIGIERDIFNKLLFSTRETRFNLFTVEHHGTDNLALRLRPTRLNAFPSTKSYIEKKVWISQEAHHWLPNFQIDTTEKLNHLETALLEPLKNKAKHRDKIYEQMLKKIINSIPPQSRFMSQSDLINALRKNGEQRFVVSYLLGIIHPSKNPLLIFQKDENGYYLQMDPDVLPLYKLCMKIIQKMSTGEIKSHSWLLNLSNAAKIHSLTGFSKSKVQQSITKRSDHVLDKPTPQNIPTLTPTPSPPHPPILEKMPRQTFSPLVWKNKTYLQLDNLYTALAWLFATHGNPLQRSVTDNNGESIQGVAFKKYAEINNLRSNTTDIIQPILSLRPKDELSGDFELFIYKSYQYYKHEFPRLQRLLHATKLKLREV